VDWNLWFPEIFWELFFPRVKQLTVCPDTGFADFADLQICKTCKLDWFRTKWSQNTPGRTKIPAQVWEYTVRRANVPFFRDAARRPAASLF
jgi:hypothetical protein